MDKFLKIQSNQSQFSATANLADFVIPQGDVYDLSDSWVSMNWVTKVTEDATADALAAGVGVYNSDIQWKDNVNAAKRPKFFNTALVRDCTMESSRQGIIESIRRIDILSQAKQSFEKSWGEAMDESYLAASQLTQPINNQVYGLGTNFNKEGDNKSQDNLNNQIMVRLGDLMDVCNATEYDTMKAGQTRIHLRLNMDRVEPVQKMLTASVAPAEIKQFKDLRTPGDSPNTLTLGGAGAGGTDLNVLSLDQVPYFVGMKVRIDYEFGPSGGGTSDIGYGVISSILWDKDAGGKYVLTFEQPWSASGDVPAGAPPANIYENIVVSPNYPWGSAELELATCELVLKRVAQPSGSNRIDYTTYSTEQGNGNAQQSFNFVFPTEAEATNLLMTFQDGGSHLISRNLNINSHQISVDNVPLTDRSVASNSPLDYDRKATTFRRLGSGLHNLTENAGDAADAAFDSTYTKADFDVAVIAAPLPVTERQKQMAVNIECGAGAVDGFSGVNAYALFKSLPRSLEY